ncbi:unnamed protein product [Polarella glacialis]|uniref:Uncharacterized protein n=1 Tax=Polarella glacialis TaxID=89957 RepID=A0A813JBG0_POLGL|nr:unnamed protein product [Polarella glacialis]
MALRFAGAALAISAATAVLATVPSALSTSTAECPSLLQRKSVLLNSNYNNNYSNNNVVTDARASFKPLIVIPGLGESGEGAQRAAQPAALQVLSGGQLLLQTLHLEKGS